jgi:protein tyrosine phosphatase
LQYFLYRNDYINASKVNGGEPMGRQWIVTQGPLNATIEVLMQ